jgi:hypothetical protein
MQSVKDTLHKQSVEEIVKRARSHAYRKLISREQEKISKDIGGILVPNAFQVPNEIIDDGWLRHLGGSEIKVLLFIIRKTFGFNKIGGDEIPLSQIIAGTGLSRQSAINAVSVLETSGLIRVIRGQSPDGTKKINFYRLVTRTDYNKAKA